MLPLIHEGDQLTCVESNDYSVGDVVVYNNTWVNQLTAHRIVYQEGDYFIMKGDNETELDAGVMTQEDILCKVTAINSKNLNS